jgi:hypothetical protein
MTILLIFHSTDPAPIAAVAQEAATYRVIPLRPRSICTPSLLRRIRRLASHRVCAPAKAGIHKRGYVDICRYPGDYDFLGILADMITFTLRKSADDPDLYYGASLVKYPDYSSLVTPARRRPGPRRKQRRRLPQADTRILRLPRRRA